jgi:hypothetical protein
LQNPARAAHDARHDISCGNIALRIVGQPDARRLAIAVGRVGHTHFDLDTARMNPRPVFAVLKDIQEFTPVRSNWRPLDDLLDELWSRGVAAGSLPILFGVFERFPDDDGAGVLWSIVHGIESLPIDYEPALRASLGRKSSFMGRVMLERLIKATESSRSH